MKKNKDFQPLIAAVETSGRYGSAALAAGSRLLGEIRFSEVMRHSAELFTSIDTLLKQFGKQAQEIEQVHISIGPGSFTGLRIAAAFAKTMHFANKCRIITVDTLDVLAANLNNPEKYKRIGTILDAKRGQFFAAAYESDGKTGYKKIFDDCLITAQDFIEKCANSEPISLLGEGLVYYRDSFNSAGVNFLDEKYWWPAAAKVHQLGWQKAIQNQFADPIAFEPIYLRQPDVGKSRLQN